MCVCVVKQVIGAVKGVGSKKDIQRSKQRGMKVKTWTETKTLQQHLNAAETDGIVFVMISY